MKLKICLLAAAISVAAAANADYKARQTVNYQSYGEVFSDGLQTVEIDGAFFKFYHSLNIETMNYGLFFGSALGCMFIIVTLLISEKINKDLNKILIVFAFILGVLTSISAIDGTKKIAQKQSKSVKQRMFNYVELKNKSIHIENQYVKDILDEVIKQVYLQADEKIVIEIFVPKDFNSPNRKNEYDETMNLLKDSGFLKVDYYYTDRDCLHGNSGCNNEYSAIRIWD